MPTLTAKALRENRAPVAKIIKDLADKANDEQRDFTAEEQEQWEKANKEYNDLSRSITFAERAETVQREQEETIEEQRDRDAKERRDNPGRDNVDHRDSTRGVRQEDRRQQESASHRDHVVAVRSWCKAQYGMDLSAEEAESCRRAGIRPHSNELKLRFRPDVGEIRNAVREGRALSSVTDTAGAYLIAEGFVNNIERALLQFGGVRQVADVMRTDSGNNLPWPTSDDTSNEGALIGENTAVSEQDISVGQTVFQAYKFTSKLIKVPRELMEDSEFDLGPFLSSALGERIGRITNRKFTTGTGASEPKGIVEASFLGKTAASATAIAADELFDLVHSVDPAYRVQGCGWMMHDNILLAIRKLKDGNGQYLWQSGLAMGEPDRLLNYPLTINQHMASSIASGAKTCLFGMLSKYKIRDVAEFRLRRLVERYADADQEGFVAFSRHDGNLLDAGTHPVKHMVH